ncbi:MAG: hypothetical protein DMG72_15280 [Acidobacteria bacterium]|nr:MAG: hypothetical protein DMG72_15280 [Acidobacteriota bacterium]
MGRDGKGFYVADHRKRGLTLLQLDLHGKAHVLWENPVRGGIWARPSPDGRHLAIASSSTSNSNNAWMMESF